VSPESRERSVCVLKRETEIAYVDMVIIHSAVDHEFDHSIGNSLAGDVGDLLFRFCSVHVVSLFDSSRVRARTSQE
ncbi:hypothetical protein SB778_39670, partial [Paraburkholderia sp. SIMBA_050]